MFIENTNNEENVDVNKENLETTGEDESPDIVSEESIEPIDSNPTEEVENPTNLSEEELLDWKKDKRYGKMWKNENDLYKSYTGLEKWKATNHDPIKKEYDDMMQLFSEHEIDKSRLKDYIDEYKSFKDPNNPVVASVNYIGKWLNNDLYRDKLNTFFDGLEQEEIQRRYPNMTAETRQKMMDYERKMEEYDKKLKAIEEEKRYNQYTTEIQENLDKCKELAESRGFGFPDKIKNELVAYCDKNNIPTKYIYQAFMEKYREQLDKAFAEKTEQNLLKKFNKNKSAGIVKAGTNKNETSKKLSYREQLKKAFA